MIRKHKLLIAIFVILILINIIWYTNYSMYDSYKEGYQKFATCYNRSEEKYDFTVKKPVYLSFTGNLAVTNKTDTLSIILWPGLFMMRPFEYGVMVYDEEDQHGYMVYVDENMEYLETEENQLSPDEIEDAKLALKKYAKELDVLYEVAKQEWAL